ncbi:hypothetical protein LTS07_004225 [Exophiala sideris]|uniref:Uncharacterized protein n=1 Tax=Exophiala sideris TaxID=1016849 RepID=A0ABR0JEH8_9EURO|nr:hypothetical protein LTS07_004225 [Exophiala sideris]KAK5062339.1 hypothetical protein LTR69_004697 [Exophiala sideris]KAK5177497.1 fat storage-inducing transmembrane protein 2 [Eurotiomycetes sp. CCFEE 6388]
MLKNQQSAERQVETPPSLFDADNDEHSTQSDINHSKEQDACSEHGSTDTRVSPGISVSTGPLKIGADHQDRSSVDEAHWAALLNEVGDVRSHIGAQHDQYEEQTKKIARHAQRADSAPTLFFTSAKVVTRSEILSHLPPKYSCDIMLTRFFRHLYPAIYILHEPTFYKQV